MPQLKDQLFATLQAPDYVPAKVEDLADRMGLARKDLRKLRHLLGQEVEAGRIAKLRQDRYALPKDIDLISGQIQFRQTGAALLRPVDADRKQTGAEPYFVRAEDTWVALHGDLVMARLLREEPRGRPGREDRRNRGPGSTAPAVRVIEILKRANETIVGTLQRSRAAFYVIPDDPRIIPDILVDDPAKTRLTPRPKTGDKVVVKLDPWEQRHINPTGTLLQVLGRAHEPFAEYKSILYKYKLNPEFPDPVIREVKSIPAKVLPEQIGDRLDLRQVFTLTIDPDDAKDFDDALSLQTLEEGTLCVGIHIADVSAYVSPGTALYEEARTRGNSTYLVGTVIPMLPHALSNGICSLVEAEDRLTKSVFLTFDGHGKVLETAFANTVIRSRKRLTYKQALAFLEKDDLEAIRRTPSPPSHQTGSTGRPLSDLSPTELGDIQSALRSLWAIASRLRRRRMAAGSLDLDMPETKIYVDEQGYADRIEQIDYDISHQLIEEYMLAANEAVARELKAAGVPSLYRVHDDPDPEKLAELQEFLATFQIKSGDLTRRKNMVALLKTLKTHPQGYTLRIQVLRSLKQACYRASPDGHYGLAKTDYTHFTSPIRRFSDLLVHQQFDRWMKKKGLPTAPETLPRPFTVAQMSSLGEHLSITERNSTEAERDSTKTKLLEFFERELKKPKKTAFDAIITDVKNHGLFIELTGSMAFGFVHVSSIRDDIYTLAPDGAALVGRRHKRQFTLGSTIRVFTERVDRFKRQIDFIPAS